MLLNLALLLSAFSAISGEIVEIECSLIGANCVVSELPAELPANASWKFLCPQDCDRIRMSDANFPRFPRELWITHQQVTYLQMDGTDFDELALGDFFHAAKLTTFILWYQKRPMSLRDNCFWGAFGLTRLDLFNNKIRELERDTFNGLPLLERLEIENNEISYISNDHFRNLPNLLNLYLYYNAIETIESEAFLYNTKLEYLQIHSNKLTELDLLLSSFINFETISLYGNQLTKVSYRSISPDFEESVRSAYIYLEENELTELYIQPNFVVEQLILWENKIERIDTLPVLRSLSLLNLQRCEIKSLDGQRLADKFVNLKTLHLTSNNLTSFSKETFAGMDKLVTLDLDDNELTEVDFPRLKSLTTLDLKNNSLTEFPYGEDIRDTFPALNILDIRDNNFDGGYLAELEKTLQDQGITVRWEP